MLCVCEAKAAARQIAKEASFTEPGSGDSGINRRARAFNSSLDFFFGELERSLWSTEEREAARVARERGREGGEGDLHMHMSPCTLGERQKSASVTPKRNFFMYGVKRWYEPWLQSTVCSLAGAQGSFTILCVSTAVAHCQIP